MGVPIDTEVLGGDQAGQTGYRIDRDRYELTCTLADERAAGAAARRRPRSASPATEVVWRAVTGWAAIRAVEARRRTQRRSARRARPRRLAALRWPLGCSTPRRGAGRACVHYRRRRAGRRPVRALLPVRASGTSSGATTRHDELRTYRVDRIEGDVDGRSRPAAFERPPASTSRTSFPADPKELGGGGDRRRVPSARSTPRARARRARARRRERCRRARRRRVEVEVPCAQPRRVPLVGARPAATTPRCSARRGARRRRRVAASDWPGRSDDARRGAAATGRRPAAPAAGDAAVVDGARRGAGGRDGRAVRAERGRAGRATSSWRRCAGCRRSSTR